jgi:uncharacterized MAPEG superfamily protein
VTTPVSGPVPGEIQLLGLAVCLVVVQIVLAAQMGNRQYGLRWAAGPRDEAVPEPGVLLGRVRRALANMLETFPLFAAAVLAVGVVHRFDVWSLVGAHLYLWARLAYLVLYAAGVPLLRSLVWNVALAGIFMVLWRLI